MGSNFDSWYRKLKIILEHERILYVLTNLASEEPAPNAHSSIKDTYQKWLNDRTTVRCIMLAVMNGEFSHRFKNAQPQDMLQMLNKFFDTPNDVERSRLAVSSSTLEWGKEH